MFSKKHFVKRRTKNYFAAQVKLSRNAAEAIQNFMEALERKAFQNVQHFIGSKNFVPEILHPIAFLSWQVMMNIFENIIVDSSLVDNVAK